MKSIKESAMDMLVSIENSQRICDKLFSLN
uniref:Uncharacterized protein n=1 Tax=viral metagenome TaxID=1070528 RepID=A0A6C0KVB0_9ZZZZ